MASSSPVTRSSTIALAPIERKRRCASCSSWRTICWMRRSRLRASGPAALHQPRLLGALDAGLTVAVDVDEAGDVAGQVALGIDAMLGSTELDARQAELEDGLLLLGRDPVLDPGEAARGLEPALQLDGIDPGQDRREAPRGLGLVDEPGRVGVHARNPQVGREHHAVSVDDVGAGGRRQPARRRPSPRPWPGFRPASRPCRSGAGRC